MRVLHVDHHPVWSGGQDQLLRLALAQRTAGLDPWIAARPGSALAARAAAEGVPAVPAAGGGDLDPRGPVRLVRLSRRLRPAVLHAHGPHELAHATLAARWPASGPRPASAHRPAVVAHRRVDFPLGAHPVSRAKWARSPDRILAVSRHVREVLVAGGVPEGRIAVVHDGVDPPGDRSAGAPLRERLGVAPDAPLVAAVGRLEPRKDPWTLLSAAERLAGALPAARWVVMGEGPLLGALRRAAAARGLAEVFRLPGFVEGAAGRLAETDVLAHAPRAEALGVAVLEAMAAGRPVVASGVGGIPETVVDGETGLLVQPGDPAALADALAALLGDPARAIALGAAGRARAAAFSVARMAEGVSRAYAQALDRV